MLNIKAYLTAIVGGAFTAAGFDPQYGAVVTSNHPDLAQFQCNGALAAAKRYNTNPRQLAQAVVEQLTTQPAFRSVTIAGPGFINLIVTDAFLVEQIGAMLGDPRLGIEPVTLPRRIIVDYGGANVAKPMHVGHLRAAIIGESIKRLARFMGHQVMGDVHLGDWGLNMGLVLAELEQRYPDWPYFDVNQRGSYPTQSPVTIDDLAEIYPIANSHAKEDAAFMEAARQATARLQEGQPGYRALWRHFVDVSVPELKRDYRDLNIEFELWLGESDTHEWVAPLVEELKAAGHARMDQGALIVEVAQPTDTQPMPPLLLIKTDGAMLYSTTDLATIDQRVEELQAESILYVVDKRQVLHFEQVFRAARKTDIAPAAVGLEHIGFGTMNGKDGKPFKTRAGGVLRLRTLIEMVTDKARERLAEIEAAKEYDETEKAEIARLVGVATLKYADLMNQRATDYVFDLDRFSAFEGRTGPYLLYTIARTRSILRRATAEGLAIGPIAAPADEVERGLLLQLAEFPDALALAWQQRAPHHLCEFAYNLATTFNRFYQHHRILIEPNRDQQASWLGLSAGVVQVLTLTLDLLGIGSPERM